MRKLLATAEYDQKKASVKISAMDMALNHPLSKVGQHRLYKH